MLIEFKQKSQVTIPKKMVDKLNLKRGDLIDISEVEGKLLLVPVATVPRDQMWFYSPEWQIGEKEVSKQLKEGKVHTSETVEKLFKDLGIDNL
jgi:antitoxin MazE